MTPTQTDLEAIIPGLGVSLADVLRSTGRQALSYLRWAIEDRAEHELWHSGDWPREEAYRDLVRLDVYEQVLADVNNRIAHHPDELSEYKALRTWLRRAIRRLTLSTTTTTHTKNRGQA